MIRFQEYKLSRYEITWGYISIIILLLFSSFSNEMFLANNTYNYAVLFLIMMAYLLKYQNFPIVYFKIILVFIIYNIVHLLFFQDIHLLFISRYAFYISLAFFTIRINFNQFLIRLEKTVFVGAMISLPLFLIQCFAFNPLYKFLSTIQHFLGIISPQFHDGTYYTNTLFYTINTTDQNRNCGFMFEPGAFGSILALTIALNLINNNFNLWNKRLIILLLALISTFSTTAFLALISILLFYLVNSKLRAKLLLAPALIIVIILVLQLPFMTNKILSVSKDPDKQLKNTIQMYNYSQNTQSLGRFAGLLLNIVDFKKSPIIGIGGHNILTEKVKNRWGVNSVNGLGNYLVTFGLIGILLLLYNLYRTFKSITTNNNLKGHYYLVLIVLIMSFSFMLLESPLLFAFQIYYAAQTQIISESDLKLADQSRYYSQLIKNI